MKTILLSGGYGTRLSEYTNVVPKPMVEIGGKPILWHIMKNYSYYGHKDFYLALGYKSAVIKEYFLNYYSVNSDFKVNLSTGNISYNHKDILDWCVTLVDTGQDTMTGGRIKKLKHYIGNETFMVTYGDGVANIDIDKLIKFHKSHGKMVTVTAVRPAARFGELELAGDKVNSFKEKPQLEAGWINGGFFVIEPSFFELIAGDNVMLEREPLETAAKMGQLMAYKHNDFWLCMDTKRDHEVLENLWEQGAPWVIG